MAKLLPPQAPPLINYSPENILNQTEQLIACNKDAIASVIRNVSVDSAEFSNVLVPLAAARSIMALEMNVISFLGSVSPDASIRSKVSVAQKKMSDYETETSMREDVFLLVEAIYRKQKGDPALDAESRRFLEKEYKAHIRMGLGLPPLKRDRFREIKKRLPELYISHSQNLREENGGIWFTVEELGGVPSDVLETLAEGEQSSENEGKLRLTFRYPDLHPTMKYCTVAKTRKKLFLANENRCNQNVPLLKEALALRDEAARLLSYADHATFVLEDRMAKTPATVNAFLGDLRQRLASGAERELEKLKALKRTDLGSCVDPDRYYLWDHAYYHEKMLARDFQLDHGLVSEYFPLQSCVAGMLRIFEELFGLVFVEVDSEQRAAISETGNSDDIVWHPDVKLFSVWDGQSSEASDFVGYLYLDLHPREGKFSHAANYTLQQGFTTAEGSRRYPATALVCNFSKPTATKPSLLKHGEVTTLFHELGHGIHNLVSRTTFGRFHGTNVARDFVEAPSQMLENWCWVPAQLQALSRHWSYLSPEYHKVYTDTHAEQPEEKMPEAMAQAVVRARHVNGALRNLRAVHFAVFDMTVHQPASHGAVLGQDAARLFNELRRDICLLDDTGDAAHGAATLGHVMGGYDAGLYGYLWSEVYAADMFRAAFAEDPMSKTVGRRYREMVLKPGGSRDAMELLTGFLGREPDKEAFYEELGIAGAEV